MDNLKIGGIIVISICLILLTINSFAERSFFVYQYKVSKHGSIKHSNTELDCEIAEGEWNKEDNFNACSAECISRNEKSDYYSDDYYSDEDVEKCIARECYKCEPPE